MQRVRTQKNMAQKNERASAMLRSLGLAFALPAKQYLLCEECAASTARVLAGR